MHQIRTRSARAGALAILAIVAIGLLAAPSACAETVAAQAHNPFPRPASIEPNVGFWIDVFTTYSYRDFIIVDRDHVWRVYHVLHLPGSGPPTRGEVEWVDAYLKVKYADILMKLESGRAPSNYDDRGVAALFAGDEHPNYLLAAQNLRVQQGLRERFKEGLLRSRYYTPSMERIFRNFGLPAELVTLAQVESGFQSVARSSAGAVGIWQFTRPTGRKYLKISRRYDERLNPARETEAAAKLLRYNYDVLGSWPLAITAYDYGTDGMARAAEEYNRDYERIVRGYTGPHFGFAVKNYYAEFLAAMQVHQYEDDYFPGIAKESVPPPRQVSPYSDRIHRARHAVKHHTHAHSHQA